MSTFPWDQHSPFTTSTRVSGVLSPCLWSFSLEMVQGARCHRDQHSAWALLPVWRLCKEAVETILFCSTDWEESVTGQVLDRVLSCLYYQTYSAAKSLSASLSLNLELSAWVVGYLHCLASFVGLTLPSEPMLNLAIELWPNLPVAFDFFTDCGKNPLQGRPWHSLVSSAFAPRPPWASADMVSVGQVS